MSAPNPAWLLEEFRAFERSLALRTAIELDLFTRVESGINTIPALAAGSGASERGLRTLCDYLTVQGHLTKRGTRYSLTLNSRLYLSTNSPAYLGSAVKFLAADATVADFCQLRRAVQLGGAATSIPDATVRPRLSDGELDWTEYARSMAPVAQPVAAFAAAALKVKSAGSIEVLDVAAGHGLYGLAIAALNRHARIFALDSQRVLEIAIENARRGGMAERFHPIPGDALAADFGGPYDLVLIGNFTHHLDEAGNVRLFQKSRRVLKPSGRIVIIDFIINPDRISPSPDASFALTVFATNPRGNIYTFEQYSSLLRTAGFRNVRHLIKGDFGRWIIIASR